MFKSTPSTTVVANGNNGSDRKEHMEISRPWRRVTEQMEYIIGNGNPKSPNLVSEAHMYSELLPNAFDDIARTYWSSETYDNELIISQPRYEMTTVVEPRSLMKHPISPVEAKHRNSSLVVNIVCDWTLVQSLRPTKPGQAGEVVRIEDCTASPGNIFCLTRGIGCRTGPKSAGAKAQMHENPDSHGSVLIFDGREKDVHLILRRRDNVPFVDIPTGKESSLTALQCDYRPLDDRHQKVVSGVHMYLTVLHKAQHLEFMEKVMLEARLDHTRNSAKKTKHHEQQQQRTHQFGGIIIENDDADSLDSLSQSDESFNSSDSDEFELRSPTLTTTLPQSSTSSTANNSIYEKIASSYTQSINKHDAVTIKMPNIDSFNFPLVLLFFLIGVDTREEMLKLICPAVQNPNWMNETHPVELAFIKVVSEFLHAQPLLNRNFSKYILQNSFVKSAAAVNLSSSSSSYGWTAQKKSHVPDIEDIYAYKNAPLSKSVENELRNNFNNQDGSIFITKPDEGKNQSSDDNDTFESVFANLSCDDFEMDMSTEIDGIPRHLAIQIVLFKMMARKPTDNDDINFHLGQPPSGGGANSTEKDKSSKTSSTAETLAKNTSIDNPMTVDPIVAGGTKSAIATTPTATPAIVKPKKRGTNAAVKFSSTTSGLSQKTPWELNVERLRKSLFEEFFPNASPDATIGAVLCKQRMFALIIRKMFLIYVGMKPVDVQDHFEHKSMDCFGPHVMNLIRNHLNTTIKTLQTLITTASETKTPFSLADFIARRVKTSPLQSAVGTGNWTTPTTGTGNGGSRPKVVTEEKAATSEVSSLESSRKITCVLHEQSKVKELQALNVSHDGRVCPNHTKTDNRAGQELYLALGAHVRLGYQVQKLTQSVCSNRVHGIVPLVEFLMNAEMNIPGVEVWNAVEVKISDTLVGYTQNPQWTLDQLRLSRRNPASGIPFDVGITWVGGPQYPGGPLKSPCYHYINIIATPGGVLKPVYDVKHLYKLHPILRECERLGLPPMESQSWLLREGILVYLDIEEEINNCTVSKSSIDLENEEPWWFDVKLPFDWAPKRSINNMTFGEIYFGYNEEMFGETPYDAPWVLSASSSSYSLENNDAEGSTDSTKRMVYDKGRSAWLDFKNRVLQNSKQDGSDNIMGILFGSDALGGGSNDKDVYKSTEHSSWSHEIPYAFRHVLPQTRSFFTHCVISDVLSAGYLSGMIPNRANTAGNRNTFMLGMNSQSSSTQPLSDFTRKRNPIEMAQSFLSMTPTPAMRVFNSPFGSAIASMEWRVVGIISSKSNNEDAIDGVRTDFAQCYTIGHTKVTAKIASGGSNVPGTNSSGGGGGGNGGRGKQKQGKKNGGKGGNGSASKAPKDETIFAKPSNWFCHGRRTTCYQALYEYDESLQHQMREQQQRKQNNSDSVATAPNPFSKSGNNRRKKKKKNSSVKYRKVFVVDVDTSQDLYFGLPRIGSIIHPREAVIGQVIVGGTPITQLDIDSAISSEYLARLKRLVDVTPGGKDRLFDVVHSEITLEAKRLKFWTNDKTILNKTHSTQTVTDVFTTTTTNGFRIVEVSLETLKVGGKGDKYTGASGQKGVLSNIESLEDRYYTRDEITGREMRVDVLMGPCSQPSRQTLADLKMSAQADVALMVNGKISTVRSFHEKSFHDYADLLLKNGLSYDGLHTVYDGKTGEALEVKLFVGYMPRAVLDHWARNKAKARGVLGSVDMHNMQPKPDGMDSGGRTGEMEEFNIHSHGATHYALQCLLIYSNPIIAYVCGSCGLFAEPPRFADSHGIDRMMNQKYAQKSVHMKSTMKVQPRISNNFDQDQSATATVSSKKNTPGYLARTGYCKVCKQSASVRPVITSYDFYKFIFLCYAQGIAMRLILDNVLMFRNKTASSYLKPTIASLSSTNPAVDSSQLSSSPKNRLFTLMHPAQFEKFNSSSSSLTLSADNHHRQQNGAHMQQDPTSAAANDIMMDVDMEQEGIEIPIIGDLQIASNMDEYSPFMDINSILEAARQDAIAQALEMNGMPPQHDARSRRSQNQTVAVGPTTVLPWMMGTHKQQLSSNSRGGMVREELYDEERFVNLQPISSLTDPMDMIMSDPSRYLNQVDYDVAVGTSAGDELNIDQLRQLLEVPVPSNVPYDPSSDPIPYGADQLQQDLDDSELYAPPSDAMVVRNSDGIYELKSQSSYDPSV